MVVMRRKKQKIKNICVIKASHAEESGMRGKNKCENTLKLAGKMTHIACYCEQVIVASHNSRQAVWLATKMCVSVHIKTHEGATQRNRL